MERTTPPPPDGLNVGVEPAAWAVGERGLQLATIVDRAHPDTIVAYVYLPEDDRAAGLRMLALMVAAPRLHYVLSGLLGAARDTEIEGVEHWLAEAVTLVADLREPLL